MNIFKKLQMANNSLIVKVLPVSFVNILQTLFGCASGTENERYQ
jgi:hypothetical protein